MILKERGGSLRGESGWEQCCVYLQTDWIQTPQLSDPQEL